MVNFRSSVTRRKSPKQAPKPAGQANHSMQMNDPIEVITPHGPGIVLYVTVYGVHGNDMWCVANKQDGRMRHYETTQLKLAFNGAIGMAMPMS